MQCIPKDTCILYLAKQLMDSYQLYRDWMTSTLSLVWLRLQPSAGGVVFIVEFSIYSHLRVGRKLVWSWCQIPWLT